jgi:hypothetical protein
LYSRHGVDSDGVNRSLQNSKAKKAHRRLDQGISLKFPAEGKMSVKGIFRQGIGIVRAMMLAQNATPLSFHSLAPSGCGKRRV